MNAPQEFHYRLPHRIGGHRPGAHEGVTLGAGQDFAAHMRLFDRPDPRRLDIRASLRSVRDEWLVRVNRQRSALAVYMVVDVSASMSFGVPQTKLVVAAEFAEALGVSAFRVGDALGMLAFDARERHDLYVPARHSRAAGYTMAERLRSCVASASGVAGLDGALAHLAARRTLVFLISDFHWANERITYALDALSSAQVVPIVVWNSAETIPPMRDAIASLHDSESGAQRTVWLRKSVRAQWGEAVAARRATLTRLFSAYSIRPFFVEGPFAADAMTRYFFEGGV